MATGGAYSPLPCVDEHSTDAIPLTTRNESAERDPPRRPPRSQTYPTVRRTSQSLVEPSAPRPIPSPLQTTTYEELKHEASGKRRRSSAQSWKHRIRAFVDPSLHDLQDPHIIAPGTSRPYIHTRQRWRLWRLTIGEFLITVILSLAYFLLLYGWSRHTTIDEWQKRGFNTLSTGISILLGLNLAGSLRSYAKLLRWRMLAAAYRPLETFDLVLGCDSQINVLRLLWRARNTRYRYLPSRTQICCLVWLLVNIVMGGIVASIGLTYNLNTSAKYVLTNSGEISVLDIAGLLSTNYLFDLSRLQSWGVEGRSWNQINGSFTYANASQGFYETDLVGDARYWFIDINPDGSQAAVSFRYVDAYATCTSYYNVSSGIYGNQTFIIYNDGSKEVNQTFLDASGPGGISLATSTNSTCGDRCTNIIAFQAAPLPTDDFTTISRPALFICQNILYPVGDYTGATVPQYGVISDQLARMFAGAIGWSGVQVPDSPVEYLSYPESSTTGFLSDPGDTDMAGLIADFTIGAIAALDDPTVGFTRINGTGTTPSVAEYLDVEWFRACALLITIPSAQFVMLFIVIWWANRAIIKDDSHLAAAKLYWDLFRRKELGEHGCVLRGEEIVEVMGNPDVSYGWVERDGANHVDIFMRGEGMEEGRPFKEGQYDGNGRWEESYRDETEGGNRSVRTVDASAYF